MASSPRRRHRAGAALVLLALSSLPQGLAAQGRDTTPPPTAGPVARPAVDAAVSAEPLELDGVLRSSRTHAPLVLEALARTRSAQGLAAAAEGAFDLVFSADAGSPLVAGKYDGTQLGAQLRQPFATNGGYVYGDYGYARGSFPAYTSTPEGRAGEIKVGAVFALLRDREIDERRYDLRTARLDGEVVATEGAMVAIGVQRRAMDAYYRWVTAGLRLQIYRQLLRLAEDRQTALGRQVDVGRLASLVLVENQQNIFRRSCRRSRVSCRTSRRTSARCWSCDRTCRDCG